MDEAVVTMPPKRKHRNMLKPTKSSHNARRCYCEGHCPQGQNNGTCELKAGGQCFTSVEAVAYEDGIEYPFYTYGCLPADERGIMQCKGHLVPHRDRKSIQCCDHSDLCNRPLKPQLPEQRVPPPDGGGQTPPCIPSDSAPMVLLLTSVTLCVSIVMIIVAFVYLRHRKRQAIYTRAKGSASNSIHKDRPGLCFQGGLKNGAALMVDAPGAMAMMMDYSSGSGFGGYYGNGTVSVPNNNDSDLTTGSGKGMPRFVQRTISKQIEMVKSVGQGRYGEVWLATYQGKRVAVKVFFTTDEQSWSRETEIYRTVIMRHDNILGFIAADIKGTGSWTQMLLITDYHEFGSLYDFLQTHVLDSSTTVQMVRSIANGLSYLHLEVIGTKEKPAVAHRDLKSKNILVKSNFECCIADFGLAIKHSATGKSSMAAALLEADAANNDSDGVGGAQIGTSLRKCGTRRYMAPEILDNSIDWSEFRAHTRTDMYSFGLVMWEIARRCVTGDKMSVADDYQVPYYDVVPCDPSIEDMHQVVCLKNVRPELSSRWESNVALRLLSQLMQECWHANPQVRLPPLRVFKTLSKVDTDTCTINIV